MGQFKPMVKMMTTEPSVELKLKKGGAVKKAMGGDMSGDQMPAFSPMGSSLGAPRGGMAPSAAPKKPSMAMRKKAMTPTASALSMAAPPTMKKGGKAEGGDADMAQDKAMIKKAISQHDAQEHKGGKGTKLSLKKGGKMATGGVVMGNAGGFKKGGKIQGHYAFGGGVQTSDVVTARAGATGTTTGGVTMGNAGGFKKGGKIKRYAFGGGVQTSDMVTSRAGSTGTTTGGVTMGNAGGFKKGGAPKKFAEGGSVQDDGRPQKMAQGNKPPSKPVRITNLAGTFKKGGGVKKMAGGGSESDYDPIIDREMARKAAEQAASVSDNENMRDMVLGAPKRILQGAKRMIGMGEGSVSDKEPKAITKTEKSVTISPASKKRGGKVC